MAKSHLVKSKIHRVFMGKKRVRDSHKLREQDHVLNRMKYFKTKRNEIWLMDVILIFFML
jgi:hypothetical protein